MGAKISKRGSYSFNKREKKKKKVKKTGLEERTTSFISLTQEQIYDDVLKSPDLSATQAPSDESHRDQRTDVAKNVGEKTSLPSKPGSDHDISSTSSDEQLYENIFGDDEPEPEEQLETNTSESNEVITEDPRQEKKRKTWVKRDSEDVVEESFNKPNLHLALTGDGNHPVYVNTPTKWEDVLNGEFWRNEKHELEHFEHTGKNKDVKENGPVVEQQKSEVLSKYTGDEQVELEQNTKENLEEQVLIAEIKDNTSIQGQDQTLSKDMPNKDIPNQAKNQKVIETYDFVELPSHDYQENNKMENSSTIKDHKDMDEQLEVVDIQTDNKEYKKHTLKVTFKDIEDEIPSRNNDIKQANQSNSLEDQIEVSEESKHKYLSKSISVNSDIYYESAYDESDDEGEEQELFYDAEGFESLQHEEQVEIREELLPSKENKGDSINHINNTELTGSTKSTVEDPEYQNVGILINLDESISSNVKERSFEAKTNSHMSDLQELNMYGQRSTLEHPDIIEVTDDLNELILLKDKEEELRRLELAIPLEELEQHVEDSFKEDHSKDLVIPVGPSKSIENHQIIKSKNNDDYLIQTSQDESDPKANLQNSLPAKDIELEVAKLLSCLQEDIASRNDSIRDEHGESTLDGDEHFVKEEGKYVEVPQHSNEPFTSMDFNESPAEKIEKIGIHPPVEKIGMGEDHSLIDFNDDDIEPIVIEDTSINSMKPSSLNISSADQTSPKTESKFQTQPSVITTPEEIAEEQMRQWEEQKDEQIEAVLTNINLILRNIQELKIQIDQLGSSDKDRDIQANMYQTLIKIMREVNGVNNYNLNERILDLQHSALNEIHGCLRELALKAIT